MFARASSGILGCTNDIICLTRGSSQCRPSCLLIVRNFLVNVTKAHATKGLDLFYYLLHQHIETTPLSADFVSFHQRIDNGSFWSPKDTYLRHSG
jgi:hypothetical protein